MFSSNEMMISAVVLSSFEFEAPGMEHAQIYVKSSKTQRNLIVCVRVHVCV